MSALRDLRRLGLKKLVFGMGLPVRKILDWHINQGNLRSVDASRQGQLSDFFTAIGRMRSNGADDFFLGNESQG